MSQKQHKRPLPRWARTLLERHPEAEPPTPDNLIPSWLEKELTHKPLWYWIRNADQPRTSHPYHLYDDIHRQPAIMAQVLQLKDQITHWASEIDRANPKQLIFVGCGSAYYTSQLSSLLVRALTGWHSQAVEAWEYVCDPTGTGDDSILIAQSATGGSFEVIQATEIAQQKGIRTFALTNTLDSPLQAVANETLVVPAPQSTGPDICVITARLMALYLLTLSLARSRPKADTNRDYDSLEEELLAQPDAAQRFLATQEPVIAALAERYYTQQSLLIVGSGINWFTAQEVALKIEEESETPCRAYLTGDFHHMAISLLSSQRPVLVFAAKDKGYERTVTCLKTARAGKSPAIAVVQDGDDEAERYADAVVPLTGVSHPFLVPIMGTIFGQLYGYFLALKKGRNPDCLSTDSLDHAKAWLISFP
ncbi:MAG: SIS domain-containing protein, partial [Armatimonadetes bacterium]|nr:SIS domain-containing protein [Armatimonadota bacterium]